MLIGTHRRTLIRMSGVAALSSLYAPFYRLDIAGVSAFEISGRAYFMMLFGQNDDVMRVINEVTRMSSGSDLVLWIALLAFLLAGPLLIAYYAARYLIASFRPDRFSYTNPVFAVLGYAIIGWLGLPVLGAHVSLQLSFTSIAGPGFWVGFPALIVGAVIGKYYHD